MGGHSRTTTVTSRQPRASLSTSANRRPMAQPWATRGVEAEKALSDTGLGGDPAPAGQSAPPDIRTEAEPDTFPSAGRNLRLRLMLADGLAVLVGAGIAFAAWSLMRDVPSTTETQHAMLFVASFPIWIASLIGSRLYLARVVASRAEEFRRIWFACAAGIVSIVLMGFAVQYAALSRTWVGLLFISIVSVLVVERAIARRIFEQLRRTGRLTRRIAVIGSDDHALRLVQVFRNERSHGYTVVGFIGDIDNGEPSEDCLGPSDDAEGLLRRHGCTGAIVSLPSLSASEVNQLVRQLTDGGFHIALSSSLRDIDMRRVRPQTIDGRTMLYIEPVIRDGWRARAKRTFDVVTSAIASIVSAPVVIAAAVAIKLDSRGPVFFRQERVGRDGKPFEILKLRTMSDGAEAKLDSILDQNERNSVLFKSSSDPRITRVGRFLRMWSIDEIPQFYNVLRGDMSVVGPRPALPREVEQWDEQTMERLRALPGITGLWQVEGRGNESFDVYKRLDLAYVDNWSLLHDLRIVWRTFGAVIGRRGAT